MTLLALPAIAVRAVIGSLLFWWCDPARLVYWATNGEWPP